MKNLMKAELYKLAGLPAYKWLLASCLVFAVIFSRKEVSDGILYTGAEWLCRMLTAPNYCIWFCVFAGFYVAGEYSDRTAAASLLCGLSRGQVFGARSIAFFMGISLVTLVYVMTGTIFWTVLYGFGAKLRGSMWIIIGRILVYCLQNVIVFGSIAFLWAVYTGKRVAAIGLSLATIQLLGSIGGNIEFMQNPAIKGILGFLYKGTVFWQNSWSNGAVPIWQLAELTGRQVVWGRGDLVRSQPDMYIPMWFSVLTSLAASAAMLAAAAHLFRKRDMR